MTEIKTDNKDKLFRKFVISDIHGCANTFEKLLNKIKLQKDDELYLLGDNVNRGKNSAKVLDKIISLIEDNNQIHLIRGNHEQFLLDIKNKRNLVFYLELYSSVDLLNKKNKIKKRYLRLLESTKYYIESDKYIFVHAGLNLNKKDIFSDKRSMLHTRSISMKYSKLGNKILIHGHDPKSLKSIKKSVKYKDQIIGIDNGCITSDFENDMGNLVCLELNSMKLYKQKNIDN